MNNAIRAGFFVSVCGLLALTAHAAPVQLVGDTITYVYDDGQAALALFGAPTIQGDTVRFVPPNFRAQSIDGVGINTGTNTDTLSANFIFDRVFSNNGLPIAEIKVTEFGDYEIVNGDSVALDLLLTANNNNNFAELTSTQANLDFVGDSGGLQTWMTMAAVNPAADFPTNPNDILITIQNTLTAVTNAQGENAFIQKKFDFVATTIIPVPGAIWLFGSAIGLVGLIRRRSVVNI